MVVLIELLIQVAIELAIRGTGNVLLFLCSFGRVRGEPLFQVPGTTTPFRINRRTDGTLAVGSALSMTLGGAAWAMVAIIGLAA